MWKKRKILDFETKVMQLSCMMNATLSVYISAIFLSLSLSHSPRLAKGHLEATVKHVFKNTAADDLARNYDEFFLNKADDIADQLKMAPGVSDFDAHQMVCDMVQVSHCNSSPSPSLHTVLLALHYYV